MEEVFYLLLFFIYTMFIPSYKNKNKSYLQFKLNCKLKSLIPEKINSGMRLIHI